MAGHDDSRDDAPPMEVVDPEMRQLLGLFDVPAYARRGQDAEYAEARLHARLRRDRLDILEMTRLRLRQWSALAVGPLDVAGAFSGPIDALYPLAGADPPSWAAVASTGRRRRAAARDLIASVDRANRRWSHLLDGLDLAPIHRVVDQYNRYYVLEKECSLRSARLAARLFVPKERPTLDAIRSQYPPLPTPIRAGRA